MKQKSPEGLLLAFSKLKAKSKLNVGSS